jgi:ATP-dependent Clp protease ATP-binding subunit ClpA
MSQNQAAQQDPTFTALSKAELEQITSFFQERLIGQPEVVQALSNVLYKQNALLKRVMETEAQAGIPADPTVLLLMGGSWGKSLAARLTAMALQGLGRGSLTKLTPLPQDSEGTLDLNPHMLATPFATVVIEDVETAYPMNTRFVANLAHLLSAGMVTLIDPEEKMIQPVPLGLSTFIMTSSIADEEIRQTLNPETRLGFLRPADDQAANVEAMYARVQDICRQALGLLPRELLRHVDETVILRPLSEDDLRQVFDLEIAHYQQAVFPGHTLPVVFEADTKARLFDQAKTGLGVYGAHALRRVLQRHVDPVVYRAYNEGTLSEENLEAQQVVVRPEGDGIGVELVARSE